jgi:hypothetical protein
MQSQSQAQDLLLKHPATIMTISLVAKFGAPNSPNSYSLGTVDWGEVATVLYSLCQSL